MGFSSPRGKATWAVLVGLFLFFFIGWVASLEHLLIDWSPFKLDSALMFLGAYAQLVLAAAVFFQIRTADRALVRQIESEQERRKEERASALISLIAVASNTRSLYVSGIPALRNVAHSHGEQAALDRAEAELAPADELRQQAHAARVRVEVLFSADEATLEAARGMTKALDVQRQRARAVLAWSRSAHRAGQPSPDPQGAAQFPKAEEDHLMAQATALIGAANLQGPAAPC